jgi:pre-mRNA-splicing factor SYF1
LYPLYVNFAKFYEEGGSKDAETGEPRNEPDLEQARQIFEKAVRVPFKSVDELAEVWCEFAELELRAESVLLLSLHQSNGVPTILHLLQKL